MCYLTILLVTFLWRRYVIFDGDEIDSDIPSEYFFPSFYAFVLYGPFVLPYDQLDINIIYDEEKKRVRVLVLNEGKRM